jgi:hypothetical protein
VYDTAAVNKREATVLQMNHKVGLVNSRFFWRAETGTVNGFVERTLPVSNVAERRRLQNLFCNAAVHRDR